MHALHESSGGPSPNEAFRRNLVGSLAAYRGKKLRSHFRRPASIAIVLRVSPNLLNIGSDGNHAHVRSPGHSHDTPPWSSFLNTSSGQSSSSSPSSPASSATSLSPLEQYETWKQQCFCATLNHDPDCLQRYVELPFVVHGKFEMLFAKRTTRQRDPWSGHVAFPGGHGESGESQLEAAVRECYEEVGLRLDSADRTALLGRLDDRRVTGRKDRLMVRPFVFLWLPPSPRLTLQRSEIAAALWVPVDHFLHDPNVLFDLSGRARLRHRVLRPHASATTGHARRSWTHRQPTLRPSLVSPYVVDVGPPGPTLGVRFVRLLLRALGVNRVSFPSVKLPSTIAIQLPRPGDRPSRPSSLASSSSASSSSSSPSSPSQSHQQQSQRGESQADSQSSSSNTTTTASAVGLLRALLTSSSLSSSATPSSQPPFAHANAPSYRTIASPNLVRHRKHSHLPPPDFDLWGLTLGCTGELLEVVVGFDLGNRPMAHVNNMFVNFALECTYFLYQLTGYGRWPRGRLLLRVAVAVVFIELFIWLILLAWLTWSWLV